MNAADDAAGPSASERISILPPPSRRTADALALAGSTRLPGGLLRDAARRLGFMALLSVFASSAMFLVSELMGARIPGSQMPKYIFFPCFQVMSVTVFLLARSRRLRPETLLDVGMVYKILAAACIAVLINRQPWPTIVTLPSWSPVAVWVLIFSLIVPDSPKRTLLSSSAAAAADPLSVFVMSWAGLMPLPAANLMVHRFLPNLIAVLVVFFIAKIIAELGRRLAKARELGNYRLTEKIGAGGMGEVWRAKHRLLARPAAVKLILPEMLGHRRGEDSRMAVQRFEREAQITAALRSPHTIVVYDFGVARTGTLYYVMELLSGLDLETLVKKYGPQPAGRVVHLLRQACHSLHEAHLAGLVHRDIKPGNLYNCRCGTDVDFLKVLDFGLVRAADAEIDADSMLTRDGIAPGTPEFMAPEIVLGEQEIDARADIYSLGCVAYWLLTGEPVFISDTAMKTMVMHAKEKPTPLSRRSEIEIPAALERIVMACLEKDPAARPQTARELSLLLAELDLESAWTEERAADWWETHLPAVGSGFFREDRS